MNQDRNDDDRPLTARSVIASTLLGAEGARLSVRVLVRSGDLFGIAEGAVRTALSRMAAADEVAAERGSYRLTGRLLERHERQLESRRPRTGRWRGDWQLAIVTGGPRVPADRARLRAAIRDLRLAELREGVWLRPDNLPGASGAGLARAVVTDQCTWLVARPEGDEAGLAARLWDLDGWATYARSLTERVAEATPALEEGRAVGADLAAAYLLSAAVLRHLLADPLLPTALLPPAWPGTELRETYDGFDTAFLRVWSDWLRT